MTTSLQPPLRWLLLATLAACAMTATALAVEAPPAPVDVAPPEETPLRLPDDGTGMVEYDFDTGQVRRVAAGHPSQAPLLDDVLRIEPYVPTSLWEESGEGAEPESVIGGDGRVRITTTTEFPWRSIVKVYFRINGTDNMCSGTFVDEDHVLTAGHCLYDKDVNGGAGAWATDMWIVPGMSNGWETAGYRDAPLKNGPYGAARVVEGRTYTQWTDAENPDHDWAVLTLDRPVGSFTGWMGRTTMAPGHANYGWYTGTLNSAGYPGDRDAGRNLYFDADRGCAVTDTRHYYTMDTGGGQSGMPIWYRDPVESSINRYVLSVHAYGVVSECGNGATRLDQDKYDRINTWRNADPAASSRADVFQLIPDDTVRSAPARTVSTLSDRKLSVGEAFQITTTLRNAGTSSTGTFYVNFYFSTNSIISSSDRYVGTVAVSSMGAFTSRDVTLSATLPANVTSGTYHVGWIVDPDNRVQEYDETDNTVLMRQDGAPVTLVVDRTLPAAPQPNDGVDGWSTLTSRTFTWPVVNDFHGIGTYVYRLDGGAEVAIGNVTTVTISGLATGAHNFSLKAVDGAGNVGPWGWHLVHVDDAPPPRPFAAGPYGWTDDDTAHLRVAWNDDAGSGVAGAEYAVGASGTYTDVGLVGAFNTTSLPDGNVTVRVRVRDGVGLRSPDFPVYVHVDRTAPTAPAFTVAPPSWTADSTPTFQWSASSDAHSGLSRYEHRLGGSGAWTSLGAAQELTLPPLADGAYQLQLRAVDAVGNPSSAATWSFGVDTVVPQAALLLDPATPNGENGWYTRGVAATVDVSDAHSGVATVSCVVRSLSDEVVPCADGTVLNVPHSRTYWLYLNVTDGAGHATSHHQVVRIDRANPACSIAITGRQDGLGRYVNGANLTVSGTDVGGSGLASLAYDANGGAQTPYVAPVPFAPGSHTVRCQAKDGAGRTATTNHTFEVIGSEAPLAFLFLDPAAPNGENGWYTTPVKARVNVTAGSTAITNISCVVRSLWDEVVACTDGTNLSIPHSRTYWVYLNVTDEAGRVANAFQTVKIDRANPSCSIVVSGTRDGSGRYVGSATVTMTASDVGGSGLAAHEYTADGGPRTPYAGAIGFGVGAHTVTCHPKDGAGRTITVTQTFEVVPG